MQVTIYLDTVEEFTSLYEFLKNKSNSVPTMPKPEPAASHAAAVAALGAPVSAPSAPVSAPSAPVSAPAAPDPAPVAKPAQSSDLLDIPPIPAPAPAAPKTVSRADVQSKAIALVDAGKKEVLQGLLRKFGVLALPNIPDEQLTAFMAALEEVA